MFCKFESESTDYQVMGRKGHTLIDLSQCNCNGCEHCGGVCPFYYEDQKPECSHAVVMGDCFEKVAYEMKNLIETRPQLLRANYSVRYKTIVFRMENFKDFFVYFLKSIAEECNVELRKDDYINPLYDVATLLCKSFLSESEDDINTAGDIVYEIGEEILDGKYDFVVSGGMEDKWYVIYDNREGEATNG